VISARDETWIKERFQTEFVEKAERVPRPFRSVKDYRSLIANLEPLKNTTPIPDPRLAAYHPEVELRPGLTAAVAVPEGAGPFPVFIVAHGNGLTAGSSHSYRRLTKDIAHGGYVTITPDFRLAPEHPFPAGFDDVKYTVGWAQDHAARYGGDGSKIVLWGDSAACALAFGVILDLLDDPTAPPIAAYVGAEGFYNPSGRPLQNDWYLGENAPADLIKDKRVSPQLHIEKGLNLPNIFLITGSADFAMGPTLEFAQVLHQNGYQFALHVLEGMVHDFMKFPELDGMREGHRLMFEWLARSV
jgi:acetyl esterase